jgi:Zn-finger nucleic acid-binding protein
MEKNMRCPVDNEMLVMADRGGVEIDYCPKCRGVWLDRGELDKIIERSIGGGAAAPVAAPVAPPVQHHAAPVYQPEPRAPQGYRPDDRRPDDRRRHDDDDDHRGGYKKKRKDSFLSDIFDF